MAANSSTGVLDSCKCRVSIRKEEKGGKNFRKVQLSSFKDGLNAALLKVKIKCWWIDSILEFQIGFVDLDLAEYAGAGPSTQRYILQVWNISQIESTQSISILPFRDSNENNCTFPGIWHKSSPGQLSSTDNPQYNPQVSKQQRTKVQQWGSTISADELNNADLCVYCLRLQGGWLGIFKTTNTHPGKQSLNNNCLRSKLQISFDDVKWLISSSQYSCLGRRTAACLSSENRLSLSTQPRLQGLFQSSVKGKRREEKMHKTSKYKIFSQGWHSPFLQCSPHTYNGR